MANYEEFKVEAITKIRKESAKSFKNKYAEAVNKETAEALIGFCMQDGEFAQAVAQSDKTFEACCEAAVKSASKSNASISDITVYRRAVEFYFPGATVEMQMTIDLCGSVREDKPAAKTISLSLTDLFD